MSVTSCYSHYTRMEVCGTVSDCIAHDRVYRRMAAVTELWFVKE